MRRHDTLRRLVVDEDDKTADQSSTDQGFVFRDFEVSRIQHITEALRRNPVRNTMLYLLGAFVWTAFLSYGGAVKADHSFAVALSPAISLFCIIVGILIYPRNMLWVPIAAQIALFFVPFMMPVGDGLTWLMVPEVSFRLVFFLLMVNLIAGGIIGWIVRTLYRRTAHQMQPFEADLLVAGATFAAFLVVIYGAISLISLFMSTLSPAELSVLGFDAQFFEFAMMRNIRAATVCAMMLIAMQQTPKGEELRVSLPFILIFPGLVVLHNMGFGGYEALDAAAMGALLALALPVSAAPIVVLLGLTVFAGLTGHYLNDKVLSTPLEALLRSYALGMMVLIMLILALRGRGRHEREQRVASIRRLSTVRGFAGVGLFTVNVPTDTMRLDPAGQRLVGLPAEAGLDDLISRFRADEQYLLRHAIESDSHASITLLLRLADQLDSGDNRVMRLHLWAETTVRNERVVYGLMVEVTEEHLQERALTNALNELSLRQDKQKQLFSIVSHEIRTPASVLSMLIDELENGHNSQDVVPQMREASTQLLSVLDDMRQAVNPEKNQPLSIKPYVPADVAERVRNTYQMLAKGKSIRISLDLGPDSVRPMMGDSNRLKQILGNLVRNAIIHSEGTEIRICYQPSMTGLPPNPTSGTAFWSVTDDGVGIPQSEIERLFQPFERGSADARNQAEGSGLGLYIAKQAIELLGGALQYFEAPEGGAGYRLDLADKPASQQDIQAHKPKGGPVESKKLSELRVVLAEDNALVAQVTSKQLDRIFGSIEHAENGRKALEKVRENPPDLLITDLFMPEMSGDELVQAMKDEGFNIPVVGLTAAVVGDDIKRFEDVGATAVLPKPLDVKRLAGLLEEKVAV
ncbi:ATP-binding protein [Thalassobius sp. Cn5-15]|uniref:ATP-binding response regulator n=1 Tax=Thalassobius sp. Cn5-15 TaxID=2917763 RepID=UPI001EF1F765|nr:ATP-binding protein [Thalassobius sp. Cn5-15]MCG7494405.1 ATP-binding protein [Thalassobius sp. Cn5-15]